MSQSTQDSANIGMKRDPPARAADSPPGRSRKRRNVVDSSSPPELNSEHGADRYGDSDATTNEVSDSQSGRNVIDTQLERMDDPQPNDPSIDWRQLRDEEDEIEDSDQEAEVEGSNHEVAIPDAKGHIVPGELREAERLAVAKGAATHRDHTVHGVYRVFLADLCALTDTQPAHEPVLEGLPWVICRNRSMGLRDKLESQRLNLYAYALVIHVWLVVCRRIQQGELPYESTLVLEMGSYFNSAHTIMQDIFTVSYSELTNAVKYWEERPIVLYKRYPWQNERWLQELPHPDTAAYIHRNETADSYLDELEKGGKAGLAVEIMLKDQENPRLTPLQRFTQGDLTYQEWAIEILISILAATNIEVIKALVDGSLSRKAEIINSAVSNSLEAMRNLEFPPPSIYMNSICDNMGVSPTPVQWQTVCNLMFEYVSSGNEGNDLALAVDQLIHPDVRWPPKLAKKGLRRYTEWKTYIEDDGDTYPNKPHRDMVRHFATNMQARIDKEHDAGRSHAPLGAPVIEIGFSNNWLRRLREHRQHKHSNYLMNLAEALFKHAYPSSFRLQQLVIFTCYKVSQCWMSEIVLTQLGQGYTDAGGGFSHYPAGCSNGSAYKRTSRDEWVRFKYEAHRSGVLEVEIKRIAVEAQRNSEAEEARAKQTQVLQGLDDVLGALVEWSQVERQLQ